jgi:glycosyltransferase involved in cell wall biosynthesis
VSRVDVIIPCYNYGRFLRACVESVLTQQGVEVRALVLDDASSDETVAVAEELSEQDQRVLFRRHSSNCGHIRTYNQGLDWATAEYALLLSADDLLIPGALRRAVRLLDVHPEVGFCYGRQILFQTDPVMLAQAPASHGCRWRISSGPAFLDMICATGHNPIPTPTVVVRTDLQRKLGGYRMELPHTADMEMWLRFGAHGAVGYLEADQAFKRMHGRNMQVDFLATPLGDFEQRKAAFEMFFEHYEPGVVNAERLRQVARRSLAGHAFWTASAAFDDANVQACQELLTFALELDPGLRSMPSWSRLAWKRLLGPTLWRTARPFVDYLRGGKSAGKTGSTAVA